MIQKDLYSEIGLLPFLSSPCASANRKWDILMSWSLEFQMKPQISTINHKIIKSRELEIGQESDGNFLMCFKSWQFPFYFCDKL